MKFTLIIRKWCLLAMYSDVLLSEIPDSLRKLCQTLRTYCTIKSGVSINYFLISSLDMYSVDWFVWNLLLEFSKLYYTVQLALNQQTISKCIKNTYTVFVPIQSLPTTTYTAEFIELLSLIVYQQQLCCLIIKSPASSSIVLIVAKVQSICIVRYYPH
jgi:hypothetical protein